MKQILSSLLVLCTGVPVTACVATAGSPPSDQQIQTVDYSKKLRLFTDDTLVGKYLFDAVEDFSATHVFKCAQVEYQIALDSVNRGQKIKTSVSNIERDAKPLNDKNLSQINKELKGLDIVGPVSLKCATSVKHGNAVRLTLFGGFVESGNFHYSFKNLSFTLTQEDFE